jgi:hypothetical protein
LTVILILSALGMEAKECSTQVRKIVPKVSKLLLKMYRKWMLIWEEPKFITL